MKVTVVNYEGANGTNGILSKYAEMMAALLQCELAHQPNPNADVNHHINFWRYNHAASPHSLNTLMVTHVDSDVRITRLMEGLRTAHGICFSKQTADRFPGTSVIVPAHDGIRVARSVYVPTNLNGDGRKREYMLFELLDEVDPRDFRFFILGSGWTRMERFAHVEYLGDFDYEKHVDMLRLCKYALYLGKDEGSMGMLDAKHCGLITIAPYTGFHIEMGGLDYPFETTGDLIDVFHRIGTSPVSTWTWRSYVDQHQALWQRLLSLQA